MNCARCDKRLSKKTARLIDGRILCSTCMFAPTQVGRNAKRQDPAERLGPKDEHAVAATSGDAPNLSMNKPSQNRDKPMPNKPTDALLALAERCEKATGPDRRLDIEIAAAIDWRWDDWEEGESTARSQIERHGLDWLVGRATEGWSSMWRHMPRYTASLDAAMTLVPEGWQLGALCARDPWFARLETLDFDSLTFGKGGDWITQITAGQETAAKAATAALALCAASLKARTLASQGAE